MARTPSSAPSDDVAPSERRVRSGPLRAVSGLNDQDMADLARRLLELKGYHRDLPVPADAGRPDVQA